MISPNMAEVKKLGEVKEYLIIFREALLEGQMILGFREVEGHPILVFNRKCINLNRKKKSFKKYNKNKMRKLTKKNNHMLKNKANSNTIKTMNILINNKLMIKI